VTLLPDGDAELIVRPPVERYDFLGEKTPAVVDDVFAGLA
jgi:hypothetical protein